MMSWHPWVGWTMFVVIFVVPGAVMCAHLAATAYRSAPGRQARYRLAHWLYTLGDHVNPGHTAAVFGRKVDAAWYKRHLGDPFAEPVNDWLTTYTVTPDEKDVP